MADARRQRRTRTLASGITGANAEVDERHEKSRNRSLATGEFVRFKWIAVVGVVLVAVVSSSALASSSAQYATSAARSSSVPPSADPGQTAGATASTGSTDPASSTSTLPFTGFDLRLVIVVGAGLIVAGTVVRKRFGSDS